jgi:hypothetical protein
MDRFSAVQLLIVAVRANGVDNVTAAASCMLNDVTSKGRSEAGAAKVCEPAASCSPCDDDGQTTMRIGLRSMRSPRVPVNDVGIDVPSTSMGGP